MDERASLPPPPPPPQPGSRRRWVGLPLLPPSDCFVPPLGYSLAKAASLSSPLLSSPRSTKEPRMGKKKRGGGGAAPTNNPLPLFSLPSFGMLVFFHRFRSPFLHFFICYFLSLFSLRTRVRYLREACGERKTPIRVGSLSDCLQKLCDSPPNPSS